jgi:hypothetical protein
MAVANAARALRQTFFAIELEGKQLGLDRVRGNGVIVDSTSVGSQTVL